MPNPAVPTTRRYVVIGAGALGATLSAELHTAGVATVLVARGAQLEALRAGPLRYVRPDGEHLVDVPVAADAAEVGLRADDVLVLATKSQDTEATLAAWAWQPVDGGASTAAEVLPVVTLQNGLDSERVALRRFATVHGAVVLSPAGYLTPGEVLSPAAPAVAVVWLGRYPHGRDDRLDAIAADLNAAHHLTEVVGDIRRWKAGKLLAILGNALDALYPASPERDRALAALREEAAAVYAAAGVDAADLHAETTLDLSAFQRHDLPGRDRTGFSTWQSVQRGTAVETDFLNGEIALLGRLHGVSTPLNDAIRARVQRAVREGTPAGSLPVGDLLTTLPAAVHR